MHCAETPTVGWIKIRVQRGKITTVMCLRRDTAEHIIVALIRQGWDWEIIE